VSEGEALSDKAQGLEPSANLPKVAHGHVGALAQQAKAYGQMPTKYAPLSPAAETRAPNILTVHAARTCAEGAKGNLQLYADLLSKQAATFRAAAEQLDAEALKAKLELVTPQQAGADAQA
jgi:hypothetical protein